MLNGDANGKRSNVTVKQSSIVSQNCQFSSHSLVVSFA